MSILPAIAAGLMLASCAAPAAQPSTPVATVCEATPEGVVWQFYTDDDFGCDVVPPQVLALTGTPGATECADIGGDYTAYTDLDPTDGWDDSLYGDCVGVDY